MILMIKVQALILMGDFENSYKIAYEFHPTPTLHWFAYYAEGYHPAGINQNPYLDAR